MRALEDLVRTASARSYEILINTSCLTLYLPFRDKNRANAPCRALTSERGFDVKTQPKTQTDRRPVPTRPDLAALHRRMARQSGFALIAVIWTLGLITLLGTVVIIGARYRIRTASSYAAVAAAKTAAESAVNLTIVRLLAAPLRQDVEFPLRCRLPGGEVATITIENEAGKIDLNTATPNLLVRLFTALTGNQSAGASIASNVIAFRDPQPHGGGPPPAGPATPRFTTVMQLDQISGMSPRLFRAALRYVTVRSGRPEPDIQAASPELLRLLDQQPKQVGQQTLPADGSVTIRADIDGLNGARFIREALVTLKGGNDHPFIVREWRHGNIASPDTSRHRSPGQARTCIQVPAAG